MHKTLIVLISFAACSGAIAQESARDLKCAMLVKMSNGKFGHAEIPKYSVIEAVRLPGPFDLKGKGMTGIACIRTSLIPIPEDVEVLQAGYSLHIGNAGRMIKLALENGRVAHTVNDGTPSTAELLAIQMMVARMQATLDARKSSQP